MTAALRDLGQNKSALICRNSWAWCTAKLWTYMCLEITLLHVWTIKILLKKERSTARHWTHLNKQFSAIIETTLFGKQWSNNSSLHRWTEQEYIDSYQQCEKNQSSIYWPHRCYQACVVCFEEFSPGTWWLTQDN